MKEKVNGYFFISHSSNDINIVRKIRNKIEEKGGNPILFYLKCLDQDSPTGKDEKELKSLISREIRCRHRFILCKSKYTEPPLCSEWIAWEKQEVEKMLSDDIVQYYEIDIDNNDNYLEEVDQIMSKQCDVLIICPIEIKGLELVSLAKYLKDRDIYVETFIEDRDMRNEVTKWFGCHTKEIIKTHIQSYKPENKGIIILLYPNIAVPPTFMQMVSVFISIYQRQVSILKYTIEDRITEKQRKEIYERIQELILS